MPRIYDKIAHHQHDFIAWRWAYFVPGAMQIGLATVVILFAQVQLLLLLRSTPCASQIPEASLNNFD